MTMGTLPSETTTMISEISMKKTDPRPLPATYAAIVFQGDNLNSELVSAIMDRQPTLSYQKGDKYQIKGRQSERRSGLWVYSTKNIVHSTSLKKHLAILESLILGTISLWPDKRLGKIQSLLKDNSIQFRVDIFWYGPADSRPPEISQSLQYVVTEAGGTIEVDFHRDSDQHRAA